LVFERDIKGQQGINRDQQRSGLAIDFDFFTADFLAVQMTDFNAAAVAQSERN
jgi:hypothetical protein